MACRCRHRYSHLRRIMRQGRIVRAGQGPASCGGVVPVMEHARDADPRRITAWRCAHPTAAARQKIRHHNASAASLHRRHTVWRAQAGVRRSKPHSTEFDV